MRKLVVGTFLTLDGVMQAPGGPDEDRDGGFEHGGWLVPYFDDNFLGIMTEWTKRAGAFLFGRKTYEMFAGSWPKSTDPADEIAAALNTRPKFVASRTLENVTWNNAHLIKGDVAEEVAKLKAQDGGEIQVHGSGDLLQTLLKSDLVDTLRIWQFPVVVGTGKRLFGEGTIPLAFRLVDSDRTATGAVLHVYERAGGLKYGEVEVGEETVIFDSERSPSMGGKETTMNPTGTQPFVRGLWGVRYQVRDVQRSVAFYTQTLGFKLDLQNLPAFGQVSIGELKLILSGPGASGSRPVGDGRRQEPGGWNRVVLEVVDLPARIEELKNQGVRFRNEMEVGPGGRQIQVEDPDGNPIELFEPTSR